MYNTSMINPAYSGSRDLLSAFILHRNQWINLDGAPITNNVSLHMPIEMTQLGIGISFTNDIIGPTTENQISTDIAYFIRLNQNFRLSFGFKLGAQLFHLNPNKLNIYNIEDPRFQNTKTSFLPNLGIGTYLFSNKTYIGFSSPFLIQSYHYNANDYKINREKLHFYAIAGHVFDLNSFLKFKPSFLFKIVEGAPLQTDITANLLYRDKLTIGAAYRWNASISGLIGYQLSKSWFAGYGYDTETTRLSNYNFGSHEIFLRYEFNTTSRITAPRFF